MKNFTQTRQSLRKLGWVRCDRAIGSNKSVELWMPSWDGIGWRPIARTFESACKREGLKINQEDLAASK